MNRFIEKLKNIDKVYFTIGDLQKVSGASKETLFVQLSRLVKNKSLIRLTSGIYMLENRSDEIDVVANAIYFPSYLSFESALSRYGILSQSTYTLTFATPRKSARKILGSIAVEYRRIQKSLFFGYEKSGTLFIATPEKALLDSLYFLSWGKIAITLKDLNIKEININDILKMSRKFPERTQTILKSFLTAKL